MKGTISGCRIATIAGISGNVDKSENSKAVMD